MPEARRVAKQLEMQPWFAHSPIFAVTKDSRHPGNNYAIGNMSSGVVVMDGPYEAEKPLRQLTLGFGEKIYVYATYEPSKEGKLHSLVVSNEQEAFHDFLGDGSYDLRTVFKPAQTFAFFSGKWVEVTPNDGNKFLRKLKKTGQWIRFDTAVGQWKAIEDKSN